MELDDAWGRGLLLLVVVALPMLAEARLSRRNERRLRRRGAVEPPGDVYRAMQIVYPSLFVVMITEGVARGPAPLPWFVGGLVLLVIAKALKYWAIASLGWRWCFRVLAPPGEALVSSGPYRSMRHPNYVAVMGEILAVAVATRAAVTGVVGLTVFGALIAWRLRVEAAALAAAGAPTRDLGV